MEAFNRLKSDDYGIAPSSCPVNYEIPLNRDVHVVPEEYRALLALIVAAKRETNVRRPSGREREYYPSLAFVQEKQSTLDHTLFQLVGNPRATVIEYHAGWKFSILTPEDVEREYVAALEKDGKKAGELPGVNLTDEFAKEHPEACHLLNFYLSRHDAEAFALASGRKRK